MNIKKALEIIEDRSNSCVVYIDDLRQILLALGEEEWKQGSRLNPLWLKVFDKEGFKLIQWKHNWMLYRWGEPEDIHGTGGHIGTDAVTMSPAEAQAWADSVIAEHQKFIPNWQDDWM